MPVGAGLDALPAGAHVGVFGGSFNPPHVAHLAVAAWAAEAAGLDRILWMPAASPPHKQRADLAPADDRLAMTRLATTGDAQFVVSDLEIQRGGVSYTVDTLRQLAVARPDLQLALVLGGDSLAGLATWREPAAILALARLVVYRRPGADETGVAPDVLARTTFVDAPPLAVSSSSLRARLSAGRTVRYLVPDAVLAYAMAHGLYRGTGERERGGEGEQG